MTTSSTSRQKPTEEAALENHAEKQTQGSSKTMKHSEAKKTSKKTRADSDQGVSKKKHPTSKMTRDQRQKTSKKTRKSTSNPLTDNGSGSSISKRNRRRKQLFTDPDQLESEIRQAYFSAASWVAIRYSVSIDDLIEHLRAGGLHHASRPTTASQYVEDIVLCVAICNGNRQAWNDLRQVFDLTLNRACMLTMSEQDSVVFVQRFLSELAEDTERDAALAARTEQDGSPSEQSTDEDAGLQHYIGLVPLRVWLTNKILATLEEMPLPESVPATDNGRAARPLLQLVD